MYRRIQDRGFTYHLLVRLLDFFFRCIPPDPEEFVVVGTHNGLLGYVLVRCGKRGPGESNASQMYAQRAGEVDMSCKRRREPTTVSQALVDGPRTCQKHSYLIISSSDVDVRCGVAAPSVSNVSSDSMCSWRISILSTMSCFFMVREIRVELVSSAFPTAVVLDVEGLTTDNDVQHSAPID